jgi:hypothetical protein
MMIQSPLAVWDVDLADWFRENRKRLPRVAFNLWPSVRVSDPARYVASIAGDVAAGPTGPRAACGALQEDLARLRQLFGDSDSCRTLDRQEMLSGFGSQR